MKLGEAYNLLVKTGMNNDPRGIKTVKKALSENKKKYRSLKGREKRLFDKESLVNPYADSRILVGDRNKKVTTALVGIDIDTAEVLLADRLRESKGIDLLISHHPAGRAYANFYEVMDLQVDLISSHGIKRSIAEDLLKSRKAEVARKISGANHTKATDAAELLGIPFMCAHTIADNCVTKYLQALINKAKPKKLNDVLKILDKVPEYKVSSSHNAAPHILIGKPEKECGKVVVDMTGGTEGPKEVFARLSQAGVGTLVCMHLSEQHYKIAKQNYINVIIAGHVSSDNVGVNILLDILEKKGMKFVACSGFRRVSRNK